MKKYYLLLMLLFILPSISLADKTHICVNVFIITYNNFNFTTTAQDTYLNGIAFNGTHYFATTTDDVYMWRYTSAGTYDNFNISLSASDNIYGVHYNATNYFISFKTSSGSPTLRIYNLAGALTDSFSFGEFYDTIGDSDFNGTNWFIMWNNKISIWNLAKNNIQNITVPNNNPVGLAYDNTNKVYYVLDSDRGLYKLNSTGGLIQNITGLDRGSSLRGIDFNGTHVFIASLGDNTVYKYVMNIAEQCTKLINITSPLNMTYLNNQLTLSFLTNSTNLTSWKCWYVNSTGESYLLGNVTNNTLYENSSLLINLSHNKFYNITVKCEHNATENATAYVNFSTIHYKVNSQSFTNPVSEVDSTTYLASIDYTSNAISSITGKLTRNSTLYNATNIPINSTSNNLSVSLIVPYNTDQSAVLQVANHTWNITFNYINGTIISDYSLTGNQTVNGFLITNCSNATLTSTRTLNFTLNDENSLLNATGNMQMSIDIYKTSGGTTKYLGFNSTGKTYHEFCIFPANASFYADAKIQYNGTGYSNRDYFLINVVLTNQTQKIPLYLLISGQSTLVTITIKDDSGRVMPNAIVKVQKFYTGENILRTVAEGSTDQEGRAFINLEVNTPYYKFSVEEENEVLLLTQLQKITSSGLSLTVRELDTSVFDLLGTVYSLCISNYTTDIISCYYNDMSGLSGTYNLTVLRQDALLMTSVCSYQYTSSSGTIWCDLSSQPNGTYLYTLTATYNDIVYTLQSYTFTIGQMGRYGETGIFLGLLLFLVLAFVGIFSPVATMVFGSLGLITGFWLGLVPVEASSVVGIVFAVAMIIWKVKT